MRFFMQLFKSLSMCSLYFSTQMNLYSSEATWAKYQFSKKKRIIRSRKEFLINFVSILTIL